MTEIEVGKIYKVIHSRKGSFVVRIKDVSKDWVGAEIVAGKAKYINQPEREEGEEITLRKSLCNFFEFKPNDNFCN